MSANSSLKIDGWAQDSQAAHTFFSMYMSAFDWFSRGKKITGPTNMESLKLRDAQQTEKFFFINVFDEVC